MLDEMTWRNASKFAIFYIDTYTKPQSFFFHFSFRVHLIFYLMKNKVAQNEKCKMEKATLGFRMGHRYIKYGKF